MPTSLDPFPNIDMVSSGFIDQALYPPVSVYCEAPRTHYNNYIAHPTRSRVVEMETSQARDRRGTDGQSDLQPCAKGVDR